MWRGVVPFNSVIKLFRLFGFVAIFVAFAAGLLTRVYHYTATESCLHSVYIVLKIVGHPL